jgi:hypothetical protein
LAQALPARDQDPVVGDLLEAGIPDLRDLLDLAELVLRRWMVRWKSWHPWLALVGLVLPSGILLSRISSRLCVYASVQLAAYLRSGNPFGNGLSLADEAIALLCQALAVIACAWLTGFALAGVSRPTLAAHAAVFYAAWLFFGARMLLAVRLDFALPLLLGAACFVAPSLWGALAGIRRAPLRPLPAIAFAAAVLLLAGMAAWTDLRRDAAFVAWSHGAYREHVNWTARMVPLVVLSWPALFLLLVTKPGSKRSEPSAA